MRQSTHLILQCINNMPEGPIKVENHKITPPCRLDVKTSMEALIHHFKLYSKGVSIKKNEVYVATEAPKGEFLRHRQQSCSALFIQAHSYVRCFLRLGKIRDGLFAGSISNVVLLRRLHKMKKAISR